MAEYGVGTNAIIKSSAKPRKGDKHVLQCCQVGREHAVFKWSSETGVLWLSQLCNEEGTHLRVETYNRLISNTSKPHKVEGGKTPKILGWISSEVVSPGTKAHGQRLK